MLSGAAQIEIVVNRAKMARYGLNVAHVRELVETAIGGATATEILDGSRRFDVVVRFPDDIRGNPEAIADLLLTAPGGERVTLGSVADVATVRGPEAINHENGERRLVVQTNVRGRDIGSFVAEAQRRLAAQVKVPEGYHLAWGGQFENQQRAMRRLTVAIPLSLAIIFLLLFITFGNTRQAGLVILNVPFALVGGIGALWLRGLNLNLSASVGFIALFGVAVLNGVVMIGGRQPAARAGARPARRHPDGSRHAAEAGADDGAGGVARLRPDGDFDRRRVRDPAPAGDGRHRRRRHVDAADAHRAADDLRADRSVDGTTAAVNPPDLSKAHANHGSADQVILDNGTAMEASPIDVSVITPIAFAS